MMRYFNFRISLSLALIGFLMVPGIVLLHFFGLAVAAVSVFFAVFLVFLYATRPVWAGDQNLRSLLFGEVYTGWHRHRMLTALSGLVFAGVGMWICIDAHHVGVPAQGTIPMNGIEQYWFGTIFVLVGIGVVGCGLSAISGNSMWTVPGQPVDTDRFKPFRPLQVLYEFDGPKTFTHQNQDGELFLAHWCDEDQDIVRYIVVPFSDEFRKRLENGQMTIRQALDQPRVWVLDVDPEANVKTGFRVNLSELPDDVLPKEGTLLSAELEHNRVLE